MKNLEQNYISVILVVNDKDPDIINKIQSISNILKDNFKGSEIVIVDNTIRELQVSYTLLSYKLNFRK